MSKPLLVGVTGGIGSGKSTVCKVFQTLEINIYFADDRAKALMENDPTLSSEIKTIFGEDAYLNGKLNRREIAKKAFDDNSLLEKLNKAVHPAVRSDFEQWIEIHKEEKVLIKEAALLIEVGSYKELDKLIVVTSDHETRISRVLKRDDHRTRADIEKIIAEQLTDSEKLRFADYIVENNDGKSLIDQVSKIYDQLVIT